MSRFVVISPSPNRRQTLLGAQPRSQRPRASAARAMGSCSSKEEPEDDGPVGGGLDGWSVGQEASMTPQQAAVTIRHSLIARSDLASKGRGLVGNEVGPEAIRHDDVRLQELSSSQASPSGRSKGALRPQSSFERRPGGAPTERQSSFERRPGGGIQPKHSFPACVLCNFDAVAPDVPGVPQIELRVSRGELVTVEIHPDMPPPDGWCLCSVRREGEPVTRGLVPWRFLVSAAHAELDVRAIQLTLPTDLGGIEEVEKGARLAQEVRVVEVRSGGTQLGVEVDERNVVVRIRPGSVAERKLRLGDEILALDETELVTLTPGLPPNPQPQPQPLPEPSPSPGGQVAGRRHRQPAAA